MHVFLHFCINGHNFFQKKIFFKKDLLKVTLFSPPVTCFYLIILVLIAI